MVILSKLFRSMPWGKLSGLFRGLISLFLCSMLATWSEGRLSTVSTTSCGVLLIGQFEVLCGSGTLAWCIIP